MENEIRFYKPHNANEIPISDVMLIYKIKSLPTDRNYYIEYETVDEQTSLQYLLFKEGFKRRLSEDFVIWIYKHDPVRTLVIVSSHKKTFEFADGPMNEQYILF